MGQNVSAVLAYGVDCGAEKSIWANEEVQEEVEDPGDIMEIVAKREGLTSPFDTVPDEINRGPADAFDEWAKENRPNFNAEWDEYREAKKRLEEACPLEVQWYGGEGFMSHVLAVKGFVFNGGWGGTIRLDLTRFVIPTPYEIVGCAEYAKKYGLKWDTPTWLLFGNLL